jgi:hypothetical protein
VVRGEYGLAKYADRQWFILCLGFPLALTFATFLLFSIAADWDVPRVEQPE